MFNDKTITKIAMGTYKSILDKSNSEYSLIYPYFKPIDGNEKEVHCSNCEYNLNHELCSKCLKESKFNKGLKVYQSQGINEGGFYEIG